MTVWSRLSAARLRTQCRHDPALPCTSTTTGPLPHPRHAIVPVPQGISQCRAVRSRCSSSARAAAASAIGAVGVRLLIREPGASRGKKTHDAMAKRQPPVGHPQSGMRDPTDRLRTPSAAGEAGARRLGRTRTSHPDGMPGGGALTGINAMMPPDGKGKPQEDGVTVALLPVRIGRPVGHAGVAACAAAFSRPPPAGAFPVALHHT